MEVEEFNSQSRSYEKNIRVVEEDIVNSNQEVNIVNPQSRSYGRRYS